MKDGAPQCMHLRLVLIFCFVISSGQKDGQKHMFFHVLADYTVINILSMFMSFRMDVILLLIKIPMCVNQ